MGNTHETKFQRSRKDPRSKKRRKRNTSCKNTNDIPPQNINMETEGNVVDRNEEAGETEQEDTSLITEECLSASARKLRSTSNEEDVDTTTAVKNDDNGCVFFDIMIFMTMVEELVKCVLCDSPVTVEHNVDEKMGLCNFFIIRCNHDDCTWNKKVATSNFLDKKIGSGKVPYEVNVRAVLAFRDIGRGHTAVETLCGLMNMPPPMTSKTYQDTIEYMHPLYIESAEQSMKAAADDIRKELLGDDYDEETTVDVDISADGSWQKKGFSSLNGLITIISLLNGKCLAYDAMTKKCKSCEVWESQKDTPDYQIFLETRDCPINHLGSAGLMEPSGVVRCFNRSVETLKLRYENFIGDGDSKAYLEVVKADPDDGFGVKKGECVGHIQKRVGSRLRKLKKDYVMVKRYGKRYVTWSFVRQRYQ